MKYLYVDYDLADAHEQERIRDGDAASGAAAFPFVKIGDDFIVGYNPDAFTRLLELEVARGGVRASGPGVPRGGPARIGRRKTGRGGRI